MTLSLSSMRLGLLALALAGLGGCSALSALSDATEVLDVYELRAPEDIPASRAAPLPVSVTIETPTTGGALQTDRIMIRPGPYQAQYLPGARWSEEVPQLVQTLMLRSLEATNALRYVGRTPLGASGDYALVTEISDFQAEAETEGGPVIVRLRLAVSIVRERDVEIIAGRSFAAEAVAQGTDVAQIVPAFDAASDQVMRDFSVWVAGILGRRL